MYPWVEERFALFHRQIRREYSRVEFKNYLSAMITAGMGILMELAAYLTLTGMTAAGEISLADYVLCIGAVLGFSTWIRQIADQVRKLWMMKGDVSVVRECLDMPDRSLELRQGRQAASVDEICPSGEPCEVVFSHVTYRYPGNEADTICDLSFCIRPGERIALVGMNGVFSPVLYRVSGDLSVCFFSPGKCDVRCGGTGRDAAAGRLPASGGFGRTGKAFAERCGYLARQGARRAGGESLRRRTAEAASGSCSV